MARIDTDFDYVFDFVLLWEPKGSVVATDANVPRRRCALAAGCAECTRPGGKAQAARVRFCVFCAFCVRHKALRERKAVSSV